MKKIIVGIVSVIVLAGCTSHTPAPTVTVTETPPPVEQTVTPEDAFIAVIEDEFGPVNNRQEAKLIDFGYTMCESFDNRGVKQSIVTFLSNTQAQSSDELYFFGYIIGASTVSFCPQYSDQLESVLGGKVSA